MSERANAFVRLGLALFWLSIVFLIAFDVIDASKLTAAVSAVLAIATEVLAWWKNNNVTAAAQEAQIYLNKRKSGEIMENDEV